MSEKKGRSKGGVSGGKGGKNKAKTFDDDPHSKRIPFTYGSIPDAYKIEFVINKRNKLTVREYRRMINSIRVLCNIDGTNFHGIPNLNVDNEQKSLIEVKIIDEERWAKFLISRFDLYLVGAILPHAKIMYSDSRFDIEGFHRLGKIASNYANKMVIAIGPGLMTKALKSLNQRGATPEFLARQTQCFFLHICEASRYRVIEDFVVATLKITKAPFPPDDDGIERFQFERRYQGEEVNDSNYVGLHMLQPYQIDVDLASQLPYYFAGLVKCFATISKSWFKYSLTDMKYRVLSPDIQRKCHIRDIRDIDSVLAILCNINNRKLEEELKAISEGFPPNENYNREDHNNVLRKIADLQERRVAFLNHEEEEEDEA